MILATKTDVGVQPPCMCLARVAMSAVIRTVKHENIKLVRPFRVQSSSSKGDKDNSSSH